MYVFCACAVLTCVLCVVFVFLGDVVRVLFFLIMFICVCCFVVSSICLFLCMNVVACCSDVYARFVCYFIFFGGCFRVFLGRGMCLCVVL